MKKLFISCPMNGLSNEGIKKNIEKMHKLAEIIFDQELEVISSYIPNDKVMYPANIKSSSVFYLGLSIRELSKADYYIGVINSGYRGCEIENKIAEDYDITHAYVELDCYDHLIPNDNSGE